MEAHFDDILATAMVEEIGVARSLKVLDRAIELYRERHADGELNPDYMRTAGCIKLLFQDDEHEDAIDELAAPAALALSFHKH
jgi:hypothetical protein